MDIKEIKKILNKYHIDSIDELDHKLGCIDFNSCLDMQYKEMLELKCDSLERKLKELEEKAICPKFKIGQYVYAISVYRKDCIDMFNIIEIGYCRKYGLYYKTDVGINLYEYYFDIFDNEEDAKQRLNELIKEKSNGKNE